MSDLDTPKPIKVFFAIWPAESERKHMAAWQDILKRKCGGRAMRIETLHATLAFIGMAGQDKLESMQLAAQEVNADAFDLCFDVARYWEHNRIVYAAPTLIPNQLQHIVEALEQNLMRHGFKLEQHAYKPHVTLLRDAHCTDKLLPEKLLPDMLPVTCAVKEFLLVQSLRDERGPRYEVLAKFQLR